MKFRYKWKTDAITKIILNQSCRPIHCCFVRASMVQPVQLAIRPGGTKNSMMPVKVMPIKDNAVKTDTYDRQLNAFFAPSLIILPFYPASILVRRLISSLFSTKEIPATEIYNKFYSLKVIKYNNTKEKHISLPG